jgi:hypothetical protein
MTGDPHVALGLVSGQIGADDMDMAVPIGIVHEFEEFDPSAPLAMTADKLTKTPIACEAVRRIDELFEIEREINGRAPEQRQERRRNEYHLAATYRIDARRAIVTSVRSAFPAHPPGSCFGVVAATSRRLMHEAFKAFAE